MTSQPPAGGTVRYCGRDFTPADLQAVRQITADLPTRAAISRAVCDALGWLTPAGRRKDMTARVALNKMAAGGLIVLPAPTRGNGNGKIARHTQPPLFEPGPVTGTLASLGPLSVTPAGTAAQKAQWRHMVATWHYLGYSPVPGAQIRYLITTPAAGAVAAASFAASAWKCAPRDEWIGWDAPTRETRLHLVCGNTRFLICPHIQVPHLASAILGRLTRRLPADWRERYGYAPVLAETFVETGRFTGTSYQAANWVRAGRTQGRGKLDTRHQHNQPAKDIWLYPLHRRWRRILTQP